MAKCLLLLGEGARAQRLAGKARQFGIDTTTSECPPDKESVTGAARASKAAGILPLRPEYVRPCIEATAALRVPGIGIEWLEDGFAPSLLGAARQDGVPCAETVYVTTANEAEAAAQTLGMPLWAGPCQSLGGSARMRVEHLADLPLAISKTIKQGNGAPVALQRTAAGPAFRLFGFKTGRDFVPIEVFEETMLDGVFALPISVSIPAGLSGAAYQQLTGYAMRVARSLPCGNYLLEFEFFTGQSSLELSGIHLQIAISDLHLAVLELSLGIDFEACQLFAAAGEAPRQSATRGLAVAGRWLTSHSGIVESVTGVDTARALPGVQRVEVLVRPGETLGHIVDVPSRGRIGYVIASGGRRADAAQRLQAACDGIEIVTQPLIA